MRLEHSIEIAVPTDVVWAANEDVERWPELAPSMEQVERLDDGALVVGSRARIKQPRLPAAEWVVTALDRGRSFSWESRSFGMRTVATHELVATRDGGTTLTLVVEMFGPPARLLWPFIRGTARGFMKQEATGFKRHCEQA